MKTVEYFDSGRIHTTYQSTKPKVITPAEGSQVLIVERQASVEGDYVDTETSPHSLKEKLSPSFSFDKGSLLADGVDTATISGLPEYTLVTWPDGEVTEINDGLIEFSVDLVGSYTFTIDSVQHTKQEITIEAVATA